MRQGQRGCHKRNPSDSRRPKSLIFRTMIFATKKYYKKARKTFGGIGRKPYLCTRKQQGTLTEWLGSGLQNRVQQFESAGYLFPKRISLRFASFVIVPLFELERPPRTSGPRHPARGTPVPLPASPVCPSPRATGGRIANFPCCPKKKSIFPKGDPPKKGSRSKKKEAAPRKRKPPPPKKESDSRKELPLTEKKRKAADQSPSLSFLIFRCPPDACRITVWTSSPSFR